MIGDETRYVRTQGDLRNLHERLKALESAFARTRPECCLWPMLAMLPWQKNANGSLTITYECQNCGRKDERVLPAPRAAGVDKEGGGA